MLITRRKILKNHACVCVSISSKSKIDLFLSDYRYGFSYDMRYDIIASESSSVLFMRFLTRIGALERERREKEAGPHSAQEKTVGP